LAPAGGSRIVWRFPLRGAVAGAVSAVGFAALHALVISDIWWSVVPMAIAGALCGACVAWSYGVIVGRRSLMSWAGYNSSYIGLLVLLAVISLLVFEPVTTIPMLMAPDGLERAEALMGDAVGVTVLVGLAGAALVTSLFGRKWWHVGPVMVTMTVVITLLGLNVSILGLVEIPGSSAYLVAELFGLIFGIVLVYAAVFAVLEWRSLGSRESEPAPVLEIAKEEI
jgi:hypothetical protein